MNNTNENKIYLFMILCLIFCIPFYFSWQYNGTQKKLFPENITVQPLAKKTKAKIKQISEAECNQLFQNQEFKEPLLFNESLHDINATPFIDLPEQTTNETFAHDELLRHLHIRKKRPPQLFLNRRMPTPHSHQAVSKQKNQTNIHALQLKSTLEQLRNIQNTMNEKMKAAIIWHRQPNEKFRRLVQHTYEQHHAQKAILHESLSNIGQVKT